MYDLTRRLTTDDLGFKEKHITCFWFKPFVLTLFVVCVTGGAGLCDPCEKDTVDALGAVSMQEREDLTASAQVGICYEKFHLKILRFYHQESRSLRRFELANSSSEETLLFASVVQGLNDEQIFT